VSYDDARGTAKRMPKRQICLPVFAGGTTTWAVPEVAKRKRNKDKMKVVIVPDNGMKYLTKDSKKWTIQ